MLEFELPILDYKASVTDAFAAMIDQGKSGVVYREPGGARLVTFDDLKKSLKTHPGALLREVAGAETAPLMKGKRASQAVILLAAGKNKYGILKVGSYVARVLSVSEQFADVYLASPSGSRCQNPSDRHYYPPYKRSRANAQKCVVCGYPVP